VVFGIDTKTSPAMVRLLWKFFSLNMTVGVTSWPREISSAPPCAAYLLLNDHPRRKLLDPAPADFGVFRIRIERHQCLEEVRPELVFIAN